MNYILDHSKKHQQFFEEMTRIPHGSFNEKAYSDYLVEFAKERGLAYEQDEVYNVIICKPATPGYEDHAPVILQAHTDMVCEKHRDVEFNFETDALELRIEDGYIMANGTTLGADDGTGVAYMLAILDSDTYQHPMLQCIFTVSEEVGLIGALALKKEQLKAKRMINLDDGGDFVSCMSSAGGMNVLLEKECVHVPLTEDALRIRIKGLSGGHSGGEIHREKGNANRLLARILSHLNKHYGVQVVSFHGGDKDNAIPREADATIVSDASFETLNKAVEAFAKHLYKEYEASDKGLQIFTEPTTCEAALSIEESEAFIALLNVLPDGLRHHSMSIEGLSTASSNLAVVSCEDNQISINVSLRGALESYVDDLANVCELLSNAYGYEYSDEGRYPAWAYDEVSELREVMKRVCKEKMGKDLKLIAVHGGLECGVFKALDPEMEIATMGPIMFDIHTPNERLNLQSFDDTFTFLVEILAAL